MADQKKPVVLTPKQKEIVLRNQYRKGVSGNPNGRPAGSKTLLTELKRQLNKPGTVEKIIAKIISRAQKGDLAAAEFIFDRTHGKVTSTVAIEGSKPTVHIEHVVLNAGSSLQQIEAMKETLELPAYDND